MLRHAPTQSDWGIANRCLCSDTIAPCRFPANCEIPGELRGVKLLYFELRNQGTQLRPGLYGKMQLAGPPMEVLTVASRFSSELKVCRPTY
jgi:hypothetical protein